MNTTLIDIATERTVDREVAEMRARQRRAEATTASETGS